MGNDEMNFFDIIDIDDENEEVIDLSQDEEIELDIIASFDNQENLYNDSDNDIDFGWGEQEEYEEISEVSNNEEDLDVNNEEIVEQNSKLKKKKKNSIFQKLKRQETDAKEYIDLNYKNQTENKGWKSILGLIKFPKKVKDNQEVVMMNRNLPASEPFVILEEKKSKKHLIRVLKYIVLTLFFFILVYVTYFSLSYQIISEDVMGLDFKFRELSIISRDHKVSLDQISEGDIIIVSTSFDWSPIIYSYDKYVYKSKKGGLVFAENKNGAIKRLERENVKYAVKMKDG